MKFCKNCSKILPDSKRKHAIYCSDKCGNLYRGKRWRENNEEKVREKNKADNSHAEKRILIRIKSKCKRLGIPFNLTINDIVIPEVCPVLSIKIQPNHGRKGYFDDSPSVDRINPSGGYTKGNVRIISNRANMLKSNGTIEEMEAILNDLKQLKEDFNL